LVDLGKGWIKSGNISTFNHKQKGINTGVSSTMTPKTKKATSEEIALMLTPKGFNVAQKRT
jgi:hypothetical protein